MSAPSKSTRKKADSYALNATGSTRRYAAPPLPYQPGTPRKFSPVIGLIGCGGITTHHLTAYKKAGYSVVAFCDHNADRALDKKNNFFPKAQIYSDYNTLLAREDINVVDIATHPPDRPPIIEAALEAGKHVLSQKPFVLDLDAGERLANLADARGLKLAINQNGRWAPHVSYMRNAIQKGLIGRVLSASLSVHWNHNWIARTPFNAVNQVVLYDFAIHWFDMISCYMGDRVPSRVYASLARSPAQKAAPPLLAQALVEYSDAQAILSFNADTRFGAQDHSFISGTLGAIESAGADLTHQSVTLTTKKGVAKPKLKGSWFPDGFHGTMAELLCAIEEKREPSNSARNNLKSLALCFAAVASSETQTPQIPGEIRKLPV